MGIQTHVMEYSGDQILTMGSSVGRLQFVSPLRQFGKHGNWCLVLYAIPPGKEYDDVAGQQTTEYLQAAGSSAEAITVEIRKPGGRQWGVEWVRYVVGHAYDGAAPPIDVGIELPATTEMVSRSEVFEAEEAADLFISYYETGEIPAGYALRPVEGYTADGGLIKWRENNIQYS